MEEVGFRGYPLMILKNTIGKAETPAIIMNHNIHMIRIVKGYCSTIKGRVIEVPFRRSDFPDELREIISVFIVTNPSTF